MKLRFPAIACTLLLSLLTLSCTKESLVADVNCRLYFKPEPGLIFKSGGSAIIGNLNVLVYDSDGQLILNRYHTQNEEINIQLPLGIITIAAVANAGLLNISEFENINLLRQYRGYQMKGHNGMDILTGEQSLDIKPGITGIGIDMRSLYSTFTFVFDKSGLFSDMTVDIEKIELVNVPASCSWFVANSVTEEEIIEGGPSITTNTEPADHSSATPLYMFENRQGYISNGNPSGKFPANPSRTTYVQITTHYNSLLWTGRLVLRYYPGENSTNSFNINRSSHLYETIMLRGAVLYEHSWRIDRSKLKPAPM